MYADRITESMQVAIDETTAGARSRSAYNIEHGIVPKTIIKEIHDINDRLRAVAEATAPTAGAPARRAGRCRQGEIEELVAQMEAEMRAAAKQLEFERAAALRDEIQQIRLRVLEEDASIDRRPRRRERRRGAAARARPAPPPKRAAARPRRGRRGAERMEVTSVDGPAGRRGAGRATWTASDRARRGHRRRLAAGYPRRARRRRGLDGALARPADLGPDGHPEHPPPNGRAVRSSPLTVTSWRDRLAAARSREAIVPGGSARSGSLIERVTLDDGSVVIAKHLDPRLDLMVRGLADDGRLLRLWHAGVFERMPAVVDHGLLGIEPEGDGWVVVMEDVGTGAPGRRPAHQPGREPPVARCRGGDPRALRRGGPAARSARSAACTGSCRRRWPSRRRARRTRCRGSWAGAGSSSPRRSRRMSPRRSRRSIATRRRSRRRSPDRR